MKCAIVDPHGKSFPFEISEQTFQALKKQSREISYQENKDCDWAQVLADFVAKAYPTHNVYESIVNVVKKAIETAIEIESPKPKSKPIFPNLQQRYEPQPSLLKTGLMTAGGREIEAMAVDVDTTDNEYTPISADNVNIKDMKDHFRLNLDVDNLLDLLQGKYMAKPIPGESSRITAGRNDERLQAFFKTVEKSVKKQMKKVKPKLKKKSKKA